MKKFILFILLCSSVFFISCALVSKQKKISLVDRLNKECVSGNCVDGYGKRKHRSGIIYEGEFKGGVRHGHGKLTWSNGDVYKGKFINHVKQGHGEMKYIDGSSYVGDWYQNKRDGDGIFWYADNKTYLKGQFRRNMFLGGCIQGDCENGFGTYQFSDGRKLARNWISGDMNGTKYIGFCFSGNCDFGYGELITRDLDTLKGRWESSKYMGGCISGNCFNGEGKFLSIAEQYTHTGGWKEGLRHGQGTTEFNGGGRYVGEWKEDKYHGYGVYNGNYGSKYEGQFENGMRQGRGTYTSYSGEKNIGIFKNNEFSHMPFDIGITNYGPPEELHLIDGDLNLDIERIYDNANIIFDKEEYSSTIHKIKRYITSYNVKSSSTTSLKTMIKLQEYDELLESFGKPKDEFEKTIAYNKRIKNEEIKKQAIEEEIRQIKQMENENLLADRLQLLNDIYRSSQEIIYYMPLEFEVSLYDADNEEFTFTFDKLSSEEGWDQYGVSDKLVVQVINQLFVSIDKARQFKKDIDKLIILQPFSLSMDQIWQNNGMIKFIATASRDILVRKDTGELIPWDNTKTTLAEAPIGDPPEINVSVNVLDPSGDGFLDAKETAELNVTLSNTGKGSAISNQIILKQTSGSQLFYNSIKTISEITPGSEYSVVFEIQVPESVESGKAEFQLTFYEGHGFDPDPVNFTVDTKAVLPPDLIIDYTISSDTNGDGRITRGETAELTIRIQNKGQGLAHDVGVQIEGDKSNNMFLAPGYESNFDLGTISSGDYEDITVGLVTNNRTKEISTIKLFITESRPEFNKEEKVTIELEKRQSSMKTFTFEGKDIINKIADASGISIDIEKNIPKAEKTNSNGIAVVIGNRDYQNNVYDVEFAVRDASWMKEYLTKTLGYKEGNIIYVEDATLSALKTAIKKLENRSKQSSEIFIYYSGHGAPSISENKSYLVPVDCDPNYVETCGYKLAELYDVLNKIEARTTTVVIDACFSGDSFAGELIVDASPINITVDRETLRTDDFAIFTSASGQQISSWLREKKHSLFTYYFLKALQGEADKNNDNQITRGEIHNYLYDHVEYNARLLNREQSPQLDTNDKTIILARIQ